MAARGWLAGTVAGTLAAVAAITLVPAWLGTRHSAASILQAEMVVIAMGQIPLICRPVARATATSTGRDRPPSATLSTAAATMSTTPIPQVATC